MHDINIMYSSAMTVAVVCCIQEHLQWVFLDEILIIWQMKSPDIEFYIQTHDKLEKYTMYLNG